MVLTKIANRRAFNPFIATNWSRMQRNQQPITLLMCDIDYFKPYNDNYGHQAGDKKSIAPAILSPVMVEKNWCWYWPTRIKKIVMR
ncbi:MAG: diguanylate cyclase (GGDEF)-like protein [Alteromonadaceae bacterium]